MFEMGPNPVYSMTPTTPPGWQGVPYMLGPIVADLTGGVARPYVPPNMATYDATMAAQVNNPLYKAMLANMYGQFGTQIGNTAGAMGVVQSIGTMAGYSPAETQRALAGGMGAFARSQIGSFIMPMVDSGLNAMGLTGGSMVGMTQAAFNGRMNLMGPGALVNPYNAGQQHQAMAGASAMATMLNNIMSQRDGDRILAGVNQQVMQGFSRERVTQLAMRAAGMGMFTAHADRGAFDADGFSTGVGGLADRLSQSIGDPNFDISSLRLANFDGRTGGGISREGAARKVKAVRDEVERGIQGLTEAMGAMRDLTGYVDEELEKLLDDVTNGDWARSAKGAFAARDAVRTLHAASQAYNIDPKQALTQIIANRTVLQDAAGFDGSMLSMGFSGGGMFGLSAQTELFTGIEDMINARGVRNDPILSGRLRQQGLQAMSRNMNTTAGKAAQVLAYARQTGVVSDDEATEFARRLTSGDSALMGEGLNRLLTTVFGSAEAGHRFMSDSMQMNSMRMAMDDNAGAYAMTLTMNGADAEFRRREQVTAASQRLAFTQRALAESGMNTWQSAEGTGKVVDNIVATIRGDGTDRNRVTDAAAFRQQYDAMIAKGMDPRTAASSVVAAYKRSPVTAQYAQEIDLAVKQQSAVNNEEALVHGGLESRQATALMKELTMFGGVGGNDSTEIYKLIREGKGAEALARVDRIVGGLDPAMQQRLGRVRADAAERHEAAITAMSDNVKAQKLIEIAAGSGYSGEDVAKAYETLAAASVRYASGGMSKDDFWETVSQSQFARIFGNDALKQVVDAAEGGSPEQLKELRGMGRLAGSVRRIAVANLKDSGYGLQMSGYWGGGMSAVNSMEARKQRDATINAIAQKMNESAFLDAKDRDTFAASVADLMMGNKDWRSLLRVYGDKDLESGLSKYGAAFQKYEDAQAAFNDSQEGLNNALEYLGKNKQWDAKGWLEEVFKTGVGLDEDTILGEFGGFFGGDKAGQGHLAAVIKAATARRGVITTQMDTKKALGAVMADEKLAKGMKGFTSWDAVRKQRNAKILGDTKVASFLDDFDFSSEGLAEATGSTRKFLDAMFGVVTDEEVAARVGLDKSQAKGAARKYGEQTAAILKEKAMSGNNEEAMKAYKMARAAQRDRDSRIHGDITLKIGNESYPAVLEGNLGGL